MTRSASWSRITKINQRDHAQGHIIPDVASGSATVRLACARIAEACSRRRRSVRRWRSIWNRGPDLHPPPCRRRRYGGREDLRAICAALAERPAESFHEAVQATWFLFVLLHLESNASSFSFGRLDRLLWPYLERDLAAGAIDLGGALELIEGCFVPATRSSICAMRRAPPSSLAFRSASTSVSAGATRMVLMSPIR